MKEKIEKKHFVFNGINIVLVGSDQSKIANTANTEGMNLEPMIHCITAGRTFFFNGKRFNVIAKYKEEELDSIIVEADVILYFDVTEDEICHCELLRETNPDCIAISFLQTGLSFNECLNKIEFLIEHAKSSKFQAKVMDYYKSDVFLVGNRTDMHSALYDLPPEVGNIIVRNHLLSCKYNSLSFFKIIPEELMVDKSSSLSFNK
ncbi:MAG: hypothetical protein H0U57_05350 [Tatlockia sp.]|nr:hypothetical protein [Tatlockia sp.]